MRNSFFKHSLVAFLAIFGWTSVFSNNSSEILSIDPGPPQVGCSGDLITIGTSPLVSGGSAPYTITWHVLGDTSDHSGLSNAYIEQPSFTLMSNIIYGVFVEDNTGEVCTAQVAVNLLEANAGPDQTYCAEGYEVTLGVPVINDPNISYNWHVLDDPGNTAGLSSGTIARPLASPSITTSYELTRSHINGCSAKDTVIVMAGTHTANGGSDVNACIGTSVVLGDVGNPGTYDYFWTDPYGFLDDLNSPNPSLTASLIPSINPYELYLSSISPSGCIKIDTVVVTVQSSPELSNLKTDYCDTPVNVGDDISHAAGNTYSWSVTGDPGNTANISSPGSRTPTITDAGNFTVTVTNGNGCSNTWDISVNATCVPDPGNCIVQANACITNTDSLYIGIDAVGAADFSWSPTIGLTNSSQSQTWAKPPFSTTYTLTVEYPTYICEYKYFVNIAPIFTPGMDQEICQGSTVQIGGNGLPGWSYTWSPTLNLSDPNIAQPNYTATTETGLFAYVVTGTHPSFHCEIKDTTIIEVVDDSANAGTDVNYCSGSSILLGTPAKPNTTYSWSGVGLDNNAIAQPTASPIGTVTYTLTTSNSVTGCFDTDMITVTEVADLIADAGGPSVEICTGGSIQLGGIDMTSMGYTYSWSPTTGLNDPNSANPTASPVSNTTYALTVQNEAIGCFDIDTVQVTINASTAPLADAGPDQMDCESLSVSIGSAPVGGLTYLWTPSMGLSADNVAQPSATVGTSPQLYTLQVTDGGGCISYDEVLVSPIIYTVNAGVDQTVCFADSVEIGEAPEAGFNYIWTPATGLSSHLIANPKAAITSNQTYTLTKLNTGSGCFATDDITLTVLVLPDNDAGLDQDICDTPIAIGPAIPNPSYAYSWSPANALSQTNISNPAVDPDLLLVPTTYTLTVLDNSTGCQNFGTVTITPEVLTTTYASSLNICQDSIIIGLDPAANHSYLWSPTTGLSNTTVSNPKALPASTTTYTVSITNTITSCSKTANIEVIVDPISSLNISDITVCKDSNTVIGVTDFNISDQFENWVWTPSTSLSADNIPNPTLINPQVNTTFTVQADDKNTGCTVETSFTVYVEAQSGIFVDAGNDITICSGSSTTIGSPAVGGMRYAWSPAVGINDITFAQPTVSPSSTTTYTVTVTDPLTDCIAVDQVLVTIDDLGADAGPDVTACKNGYITLAGLDLGTGYTYNWTPTNGLDDNTIHNPTALITISTIFTLEVTETASGCTSVDQVIVTMNAVEAPSQSAGIDQSICSGESVEIGPQDDGSSTYTWSPTTGLNNANIAKPLASPTTTTTYVLEINTGSCIGQSEVTITVTDDFVADAGSDQNICSGNGVTLGSPTVSGLTYSWAPIDGLNDPSSAQPLASPGATTFYTLTVQDATGCVKQDHVVVTIEDNPLAQAGANATICELGSVQLGTNPAAGTNYSWSPSSGLNNSAIANPIASPLSTTTYTVTSTDIASGCIGTDNVTITVNSCDFVCPILDSLVLSSTYICSGDSFSADLFRSQNISSLGLHYSLVSGGLLTPTEIYSGAANTITDPINIDQSVVINELTYWGSDTIELWNTGADTIDIANWWICSRFEYQQISTMNLESGSLVMNPGDYIVLTGFGFDDLAADVGLYNTNDFTNPSAMVDFVQYGIGGLGRESVAASKGIWTAGSFVPRVSNSGNLMSYDGSGNTPGDWSEYSVATYGNDNTNQSANVTTTQGNITLPDNMTGGPIDYYVYASLGIGNPLITSCSLLVSTTITVNPNPTISASPDVSICMGDTATISASGGVSYSWTPLVDIDDANSASPKVYPSLTTKYYVEGTDIDGCSSQDSITIEVHPLPDLIATSAGICQGESVDLSLLISDANGLDGTLSYYQMMSDAEAEINPIASVVSPATTSTYFIRKNTTTSPSCFDITSLTVTVKLPPSLQANDISICEGTFVDLSTRVSDLNSVPNPIIFYPTQVDADNETNALVGTFVNPATTTIYFARKNSETPASCYDTEQVTITVIPFPSLVTVSDTICFGSAVNLDTMVSDLNPTPGVVSFYTSLSDATGAINPISSTVSPLDTTKYYVRKSTSTTPPCSSIDSLKVYVISCMFDVALKKTLGVGQSTQTNPGDSVDFAISIYNQGIVTAYDIRITDYLDGNTSLADSGWVASGLNATKTIDEIAVGDSIVVPIRVKVNPSFMGTTILNAAEITFATNIDGRMINIEDIDSQPDNTNGNDVGGTVNDPAQDDNISDDGTIDEDDHDIEDIEVIQIFDLALIHSFSSGEPSSYLPGDTVSLDITVTNEGTLNAYDILLIHYAATGLNYLDGGWSENLGDYNFNIPILGSGAIFTTTIRYTVDPHYTLQTISNNMEIAFATETDGSGINTMDDDSFADTDELNGTSEDDFSNLLIPVTQGFDLALRKTLSSGQAVAVYPGDTAYFDIQVINQGIEDAFDIIVTDYVPIDANLASPSWSMNGANAEYAISSLPIGQDTTIQIGIAVDVAFTSEQMINLAEISFATDIDDSGILKDDQDSDFDDDAGDDLGGGVNIVGQDDEVDDRGIGDEDDHDPEDIVVCNIIISDNTVDPTCNGGTDGSIDVTISGGLAPFSYQWADGFGFTEDISNLPSGTYSITVTDANTCEATANFTINDPALFAINAITTDADCGLIDGSISLSISGANPIDYDWDDNTYDGQSSLSGLSAGTYGVTVTDDMACQNDTLITINSSSGLTISVDEQDISCQFANDGFIGLVTSGGTAPYSFDWSDDTLDGLDTLSNVIPGTYNLTVTDFNSCSYISSFTIDEPIAIAVDTAVQRLACSGDGNGIIDLNVSGGTPPFSYEWNNGLPGQQDQTGLSAGTFKYTVTDNNSCEYVDSVVIEDPIEFLVTATTNTPVCEGDTLTLSAMNGVSYTWSGPDGFISNDSLLSFSPATPDLSGTYTLVSFNQNACRDTLEIIANVFPTTGNAMLDDSTSICNINLGNNENVIDLNDLILAGDMSGIWSDTDASGNLVGSIFTAQASMADLTYTFTYTISGMGDLGSACGDRVYDVKITVKGCGFDLALDKLVIIPGDLGDTVSYNLIVHNQGDADAHDVQIKDHLPSGFVFQPSLNPEWLLGSDDISYTFANAIGKGQKDSVILQLIIESNHQATSITNTAEIQFASSTPGGGSISDKDSNTDNFTGTVMEDDESAVSLPLTQTFDLSLDVQFISGQSMLLSANDTVAYQIIVSNEGSLDAYDVDVKFDYPSDLVFNAGISSGWTDLGGMATFTFATSISSGSSDTIEIGFNLITGSEEIIAEITTEIQDASNLPGGSTSPDEDSTPNNSNPGEDDIASLEINIDQTYDLALTLTTSVDSVNAGDTVRFDLTITNQSTLPADDVTLVMYLPSDLIFDPLLNPGWTPGTNGRYYFVFSGSIGVGTNAMTSIQLVVGENVLEGINISASAEIVSGSFKTGGVLLADTDGTFDDISSNDGIPIDDAINNPADEDNHDIASLHILTGGCSSIIVNNINLSDETCVANDGTIMIDIVNPENYSYTWSPNIGISGAFDNERSSLNAGRYDLTITEIADPGCVAEVMIDLGYGCLPPIDTLFAYISFNGSQVVCMDNSYITLPKSVSTAVFCDDGSGTNPPAVIGSTTMDPLCIQLDAYNDFVGRFPGLLCVVHCTDDIVPICDTTMIVATVIPNKDIVKVQIPSGEATSICLGGDAIQIVTPPTSSAICAPGSSASVAVSDWDGSCIELVPAPAFSGISTDTICVISCYDDDPNFCDTTLICVEVTNANCPDYFAQELIVQTGNDMSDVLDIVVNASFENFASNYSLAINGASYTGPLTATTFDTLRFYPVQFIPGSGFSGPYDVELWNVNGTDYGGIVADIFALVDSMNVWDPGGGWTYNPIKGYIKTENLTNTYGSIFISQVGGATTNVIQIDDEFDPQETIIQVPTGLSELVIPEICPDTLIVAFSAPSPSVIYDTIFVGRSDQICIDFNELTKAPISVNNYCPDSSGDNANIVITGAEPCLNLDGLVIGTDTACIVMCDEYGFCDTTTLYVYVRDTAVGPPVANVDTLQLFRNQFANIPILMNDDTISAITSLDIVGQPLNGDAFLNADNTIRFEPDLDYCSDVETQTIQYMLCNIDGCSIGIISIQVLCDELAVNNGFSPNGDGVNDAFYIDAALLYPNNVLRVFNRWGAQVFKRGGYQNDWEGTWDNKHLPDGVYWYVFETGEGQKLSGYVVLYRN